LEDKKMILAVNTKIVSKKKLWTSRILVGLAVLFLFFDSIAKILKLKNVVEVTTKLGWPENLIIVIGVILFICTILYLIPRTSILGAILLTGYLGGAVATQASAGNPLFSNVLFPVYLGVMLWGGLYLRDEKVKNIIPIKKGA
jgi:DoxX-like family